MKSTGLIRRIDDLGRVVIPKEIRRSLNIREGDPLEVYVNNGTVIYKKHSPLQTINDIAETFATILGANINKPVVITDTDYIVAASISKREYLEKPISSEAQTIIYNRHPYYFSNKDNIVKILSDKRKGILILHPILSNYEVIGSIVVLKDSVDTKPTDFECKMVKHTAELLGKQLENV